MFAPNPHNDLVRVAEVYAAHRRLRLTTVSKYSSGSAALLPALKRGSRGITVKRMCRVLQWFSDHWPGGLAWPPIERPPINPDSPAAKAMAAAMLGSGPECNPEPGSAVKLNSKGEVANIERFARDHILSAHNVRACIRTYGIGGPKDGDVPRKGSEMHSALAALLGAGDSRFRQVLSKATGNPVPAAAAHLV